MLANPPAGCVAVSCMRVVYADALFCWFTYQGLSLFLINV
jgi:hypothetical protein